MPFWITWLSTASNERASSPVLWNLLYGSSAHSWNGAWAPIFVRIAVLFSHARYVSGGFGSFDGARTSYTSKSVTDEMSEYSSLQSLSAATHLVFWPETAVHCWSSGRHFWL